MRLLLTPFATFTAGDEPSAKLARQLPRMIGRDVERACAKHGLTAKYLSARGTTASGIPGLVATTELPSAKETENLAEMYGADLTLTGRFGLSDTALIIEGRLFRTSDKQEVYAKRFETYPTYYFDAVEEIKTRIVQSLGIELDEKERAELFTRVTESWQAYLFFLLAEDERYGISIGIVPGDILQPLELYRHAIETDSQFEEARTAMQHYVILLIEQDSANALPLVLALKSMNTIVPADFIEAIEEIA
jgi:hypothetical protein